MSGDDPGRRFSRRRLLQGAGAAMGLTAATVVVGRELYAGGDDSPWDPDRSERVVFGMLGAERDAFPDLDEAGVTAVTLSVPWSQAEPEPGRLDGQVVVDLERTYRAARASGLSLALSPGMQYPPDWVHEIPASRFVDQNGTDWRGPVGEDVADAVFNDDVRSAQGEYLALLAEATSGWELAAVRIGGLARGELHYPPVDRSGTRNTYWAFGEAAQDTCPVPGFRPGEGSTEDAGTFLEWYLDALSDYGRWQVETVRERFGPAPRMLVLLPSWGVRPGEVDAAVDSGLDGSTPGETRGTLTEGVAWERQVADLTGQEDLDVCTTWLDAPSQGDDEGSTSPARFLAALARRHGLGMWGENTGDNTAEDLRRCVRRVHELGLRGMFWMGAEDLGEDGNATLADYARVIRGEFG